jgi:hypothetical protein
MGRLIKIVFVLAFLCALALAGSYAGAFFRAGALIGTNTPAMGPHHVVLNYHGVESLPGKPIAWVFTYTSTKLPGVSEARIYVSPTATVIATKPPDLAERLDAWAKARTP